MSPRAIIAFSTVETIPSIATIEGMIVSIRQKNDELLTTTEAAEYLGFAEDTVRRYVYRGLLHAEKFGNTLIIRRSECDRYNKTKRSPGRPKQS